MEKINVQCSGNDNLKNSVENALYMLGIDTINHDMNSDDSEIEKAEITSKEVKVLDFISTRMFHFIMTSHPTDGRNWLELSYLERLSIEDRKWLEDKAEWEHIDNHYWS